MNLPDYFLADLPPNAELTATMIAEACQMLKRNRALYLAPRSTLSLIELHFEQTFIHANLLFDCL